MDIPMIESCMFRIQIDVFEDFKTISKQTPAKPEVKQPKRKKDNRAELGNVCDPVAQRERKKEKEREKGMKEKWTEGREREKRDRQIDRQIDRQTYRYIVS